MKGRACQQCGGEFAITDAHLAEYARLSPRVGDALLELPPPRCCPECRKQRRLAFRNERRFYLSRSALSGKEIVSTFSPDKPYLVYHFDEWWSEAYQPLDFGRDFDFQRPFFEQFAELMRAVPQMALVGSQNENCPYCHLLANCKNCYVIVESSNNEDCYYSYWMQKCEGCCDCSFCHECRYCYEIDNCYSCYELKWSRDCTNCSESSFLESCIGCRHCYGCVNLHQKEYWIYNQPVGRAAYEAFLAERQLSTRHGLLRAKQDFATFFASQPKKFANILNSESCSGNFIVSCRNCTNCYHAHDAEECRFAEHVWRNSKYNMDVSTAGRDAELIYESINVGISSYRVLFSIQGWSSQNIQYCIACFNSQDSFGCVGLKHQRYCILNRQYSQVEYAQLVPLIVEHMKATGEWGEFFPPSMSPFGYNETVASSLFPLTEAEAVARGFPWSAYQSPPPQVRRSLTAEELPDALAEISDEILQWAILCGETGRPFKIISQELEFYRRFGVPLPTEHPDVRHERRNHRRQAQELRQSNCSSCQVPFLTPYPAEDSDKLLCSECYAAALV